MKANVQYNDFIGTAAADVVNQEVLNDFLKSKNVDTARYSAVGAKFYAVENSYFEISVICKDLVKSTAMKNHLVTVTFEQGVSVAEFFAFFKRFEVVLSGKNFMHDSVREEIVY